MIGAQHADDIWLSLDFDRENLDAALVEFEQFYYHFSGLKIN